MPPVETNEALLLGITNADMFIYLSIAAITTVILFTAIKLIKNNKIETSFLHNLFVKKLS
ncbi:hypothetical protein OD91_0835 [Lutibacter sp. Hel_I_33_5]|nr:hypothetical protein OD91_0835 [Lutibacter sp. Hel_I_33_5]